jgi:hypothetical protein
MKIALGGIALFITVAILALAHHFAQFHTPTWLKVGEGIAWLVLFILAARSPDWDGSDGA